MSEGDKLLERIARAICKTEGVDPDFPCPGLGVHVPIGETWPAWKVRLPKAKAALEVIAWERVTLVRRTAGIS